MKPYNLNEIKTRDSSRVAIELIIHGSWYNDHFDSI